MLCIMNFSINFHLLKILYSNVFLCWFQSLGLPLSSGPALHKHLSESLAACKDLAFLPPPEDVPGCTQELPIAVLPTNCFLKKNLEVFSFAKSICPCDAASVSVLRLDKTSSLIHCQADLQKHWCEPTPVSQQCLNLGIQRSPQSAERLLHMSFHRAPGHMAGTN